MLVLSANRQAAADDYYGRGRSPGTPYLPRVALQRLPTWRWPRSGYVSPCWQELQPGRPDDHSDGRVIK
jgi:hypothetical protein